MRPDLDNTGTWTQFRKKLCASCQAWCCRLPVEVRLDDLIRLGLLSEFDRPEELKILYQRLHKAGIVEHLHQKSGKFTLSRRANGDCLYLGTGDRRCQVYQQRPDTCRNHPQIGPRPGYCPYCQQAEQS